MGGGKFRGRVPWTNERPLENRELNAIIGAWFTLWFSQLVTELIALRNFKIEDMELESINSGPTAKLPILKLENGDSWVLVPQTIQKNGTTVTKMSIPVIAEEKTNKKNDVKARSLLLMALPNEHQLIFSQYPDTKSMFWGGKGPTVVPVGASYGPLTSGIYELIQVPWTNERPLENRELNAIIGLKVSLKKLSDHLLGSDHCKDYEINVLKSEFEKVKQEKDGIEFKIEKFNKASKYLDHLLGSQITDKCKKGLGYSADPPPHPLIYNRPKKLDLSYSGLDEFKEPEFKGYGPKDSEQESNVVEFTEPKNHEKLVKKSVRYAEMYRSQSPRGNQRNWNGHKSNQLGKDFVMYNKACFICGSFNHLHINYDNHQRKGIVFRNNYSRVDAKTTHPSVLRNMSPKAVLLKTGLTPLNTVRPVNIAHIKTTVHSAKSKSHFFKQAQSTTQRPFYKQTTLTRRHVHTAKRHHYTGRPRSVNAARSYTGQVSAIRVKEGKPQQDDKGFVDSGCSRHITGNIAHLSDFKEFDRGYV
ncbi:hypothetical protein Tco_1221775, partial [Tanacetum coccineum]